MKPTDHKFFMYVRKSTDESDRQVLSIQAQLFEPHELAKREGLTVVGTFEESRTAKQPGRPQFNLMLGEIERGKADGIISWHPDRLARNSVDGGRIVYLVDIGKIRDLRFPTFRFEASAHGKFMLNIAFSQSKYYVDNLSENIKRGIRQKLRNGIWPNRPPAGYVNDRNKRCIEVVPDMAKLVREAFLRYATGNYPIHEVRKQMNALGLRSCAGALMSTSNYQSMLTNPFYYGVMKFQGELYEGKHQPIITKALFDKVQEVMKRKSKSKTSSLKPYRYRGLFRCGECGCFITTETQKGHNYLHCTKRVVPCTQKFVREEVIDAQVEGVISKIALEAAIADKIIVQLESEREEAAHNQQAAIERIQADLAECEKKADRLLDMRLNEQISETEYVSKKHALVNEKAELKGKLEAFEQARANRFEPSLAFVNEAKNAALLLVEKNRDKNRDFLRKLGSNLHVAEQALKVEFKNPWKLVADFNSTAMTTLAAGGENQEIERWRRGRDSNPRYRL